jgi:ABC-type sugar transport system ATPase subunit
VCLLGVRPEHVHLLPEGDLVVRAVEDQGHEAHVVLDTPAGRLLARVAPGAAPAPGARVGVRVDPADVLVWPA